MGDNCLRCKHLRLKEKTIPAASQPPFLGSKGLAGNPARERAFQRVQPAGKRLAARIGCTLNGQSFHIPRRPV
jgi:hypothetical protein